MVVRSNRRTFVVFAFVILPILCSPTSLRAQRHCCEGDTWINWTEGHREDYVRGYILGHAEGYTDACYRMAEYWPSPIILGNEKNPLSKCLKQMPDFSRGPEYYSKQITELYSTYPKDRILLITEILGGLGSGKSIQDIHEHPPFPTHSSLLRSDSPKSH
jgi:hypothetical protein